MFSLFAPLKPFFLFCKSIHASYFGLVDVCLRTFLPFTFLSLSGIDAVAKTVKVFHKTGSKLLGLVSGRESRPQRAGVLVCSSSSLPPHPAGSNKRTFRSEEFAIITEVKLDLFITWPISKRIHSESSAVQQKTSSSLSLCGES